MNQPIFREKSMEKISSPEQLNDYIRVSNPSVWMILLCVIVLLIGVCVWGVLGHLDTTVSALAVSDGTQTLCYIRENDSDQVQPGDSVLVDGKTLSVLSVSADSVQADFLDSYTLHIGALESSEWVHTAVLDGSLSEGTYTADIVVESIAPISFVMN